MITTAKLRAYGYVFVLYSGIKQSSYRELFWKKAKSDFATRALFNAIIDKLQTEEDLVDPLNEEITGSNESLLLIR